MMQAFLVPITLAFQPVSWTGWTLLHVINLVAGACRSPSRPCP